MRMFVCLLLAVNGHPTVAPTLLLLTPGLHLMPACTPAVACPADHAEQRGGVWAVPWSGVAAALRSMIAGLLTPPASCACVTCAPIASCKAAL